jgi:multimeric flavodoxin WrbA
MHIMGILGSPRGKNSLTLKLIESALRGAEDAGAEVEFIDVARKNVRPCRSCGICYSTGKCSQKDDFQAVYEKVLEADGLVLGSPAYFNSVSAQLKLFIDRTGDAKHCMMYRGKYGMSVSTTASSGVDDTVNYMNRYLLNNGAFVIGGVGVRMPTVPGQLEEGTKKAYAMGKDLFDAIKSKRPYPEQLAVHDEFIREFRAIIKYNKDSWKHEYEYYAKKGWL